MTAILRPTFIWPMDKLGAGSQRCRMGLGLGDVEAYAFTSADSTTLVSAAKNPEANGLVNSRFGRTTFPVTTGTAPDRPPGIKLGMGVSTWALAQRNAGRAIWIAQAWTCPHDNPFRSRLFPAWQDFHNETVDQFGSFRVRSNSTVGATQFQLQTWMAENNGADEISASPVGHDAYFADIDGGQTLIGLNSGRVTEILIQATPNDPNLSSETHKHNMSVWIRTWNTDGSLYFGPTLFTHYTPGSSGANAWNTRIEKPFHMGRTIGENTNDGYKGDLLGVAMGAFDDGAMLDDAEEIAALMDAIWNRAEFGIAPSTVRSLLTKGVL